MTEAEYKTQLKKARANYELKQMLVRGKKATADDVADAKRILDNLIAYQLPVPDPDASVVSPDLPDASIDQDPTPGIVQPAMAVSDFTSMLEDLTIAMADANKEMCQRCNQLADHTDQVTLKRLVDEIDEFFYKRNDLGEKIAFLKLNGRLPEAEPAKTEESSSEAIKDAFLANLPVDKYKISQLITNSLSPKVSRAKKALRDAKTEITKAHYRKQLAKAELELDAAKSQLTAMA